MSKRLSRNEVIRVLCEQLGRHRVRWLPVKTSVQIIRRLIVRAYAAERGGCIYFDGSMNQDGYVRLNIRLHGNHLTLGAHRIAGQFAHHGDDIPHYKEAAHDCDCPPCIHPEHVHIKRRRHNRAKSARNTNAKKAARRASEHRMAA